MLDDGLFVADFGPLLLLLALRSSDRASARPCEPHLEVGLCGPAYRLRLSPSTSLYYADETLGKSHNVGRKALRLLPMERMSGALINREPGVRDFRN